MLAIVIPYYKYDFFEATLQSLAGQTNQNFHVYIGDDASLKSPTDLLHKYQGQFAFSYQRFEHNLGGKSLVQQWERCLDMANHEEWIMILGDDDVLSENCVAKFYENLSYLQENDISVVRFASQVINEKSVRISDVYKHPKEELAADFLHRKMQGGSRSSLSEYIFKSDVVKSVRFKNLPLAWYSDLLAVLEFSIWRTIFTINEAIVYFRWSGVNITSKTDDIVIKNEATFQFYYYLLSKCSAKLSPNLVQLLLDKIEKTFLDNKKNFLHWMQLFELYVFFFQFKRLILLFLKIKKSMQ